MTAPAVTVTTAATSPAAGPSGMYGAQLPVAARVTANKVTVPAASPVTITNAA